MSKSGIFGTYELDSIGVGPKTATKLLNAYGSIEGVLAHVHEVRGDKLKQSLAESEAVMVRNQKMVRLDSAVAGVPEWSQFGVAEPSISELLAFFKQYEFHGLVQALREPELF